MKDGTTMICPPINDLNIDHPIGEPFIDVGVGIRDTEGWAAIMPCGLTNGYMGYFPMKSAFDEGGYEARSSKYKSGIAETIIEKGKELLNELKN